MVFMPVVLVWVRNQSKPRQLTMTLHLTLKMTTAQVVEMSVTNNSLSKDYPHPDDHIKQITEIPLGSNHLPYFICSNWHIQYSDFE